IVKSLGLFLDDAEPESINLLPGQLALQLDGDRSISDRLGYAIEVKTAKRFRTEDAEVLEVVALIYTSRHDGALLGSGVEDRSQPFEVTITVEHRVELIE